MPNVAMSTDTRKALKDYCSKKGLKMSYVMDQLILDYLSKEDPTTIQ